MVVKIVMAYSIIPPKAKLFIGMICNNDEIYTKILFKLKKKYGPIDFESIKIPFTHTEYYNSMGANLYKKFISFKKLIPRESIVDVKLYTNKLEQKYAIRIKNSKTRTINIDPGYLTLSNIYLASCKEYFHRTYLSKGIYLENEYKFTAKKFHPWEWTYPDYQKPEYLEFFHELRIIYYKQLRNK